MGLVERALHENFEKWVEAEGSSDDGSDLTEEFYNYMEEEFQIKERGENILDLLSTMIAPSSESSSSSGLMKNQMACAGKRKRTKRSTGKISS